MTCSIQAMAINLDLGRELYTEVQRKTFYVEYAEALSAVQSAFKKITEHEEVDPTGWKFWKRRPADWTKENDVLYSEYRTARFAVNELERAHPLLATIYAHKGNPLIMD
uniref:Uncharacterized protein n=1 Tax=Pseudomonas fluorescens (strain SBW25) TaxID=216595 RepID=A0A0G4E4F3_PSEFS|nr:hypothetical protein [Pseudomonas fluorescens]CEK42116.1 hypothetical protein PQBR57_0163 [Pseudomonas fluorescens SBW25]